MTVGVQPLAPHPNGAQAAPAPSPGRRAGWGTTQSDPEGRAAGRFIYSPAPGRHYFGFRLIEMVARPSAPAHRDLLEPERRKDEAEFVACLAGSWAAPLTFELRVLSHPEPARPERGRIAIALLARADKTDLERVRQLARQIPRLVETFFNDCVFKPLDATDLRALLAPFPVGHLAAITRQVISERLDTASSGPTRPPTGFATGGEVCRDGGRRDEIVHVIPFVAAPRAWGRLFRVLLLQPDPVAISIRLRPTALSPEEDAFLGEQLVRCERYMQIVLGAAPVDPSSLRPTLREQAALYQHAIARRRAALRTGAVLLTVTVASAGSLGPIVDVLGGTITAVDFPLHGLLPGGYRVTPLAESLAEAAEAFEGLGIALAPHSVTPSKAHRLFHLFDTAEAAAAFRLPCAALEELPGVTLRSWQALPPPAQLGTSGYLLGVSRERAGRRAVRIAADDLRHSLYVVGATGTGKTTLLRTMILDAMQAGAGLAVVCPHGDLYKDLLGRVPEHRLDDVVLLDPTDENHPLGLNMLEHESEDQRHFLVRELVGIMARLLEDEYGGGGRSRSWPGRSSFSICG